MIFDLYPARSLGACDLWNFFCGFSDAILLKTETENVQSVDLPSRGPGGAILI